MKCTVYRVGSEDGTYVYVREGLDLGCLPPELQKRTARMHAVMHLELGPERRLARVDVAKVMADLKSKGWYLQLPPNGLIHVNLHFGD